MTFLVMDRALRMVPSHWERVEIRRVVTLRRETNADSTAKLLSLSASDGVRPRPDDGGRQLPSADTVANYWLVHSLDLVFNPMWAIEGGVAVSAIEGAVSTAYRVYEFDTGQVQPRFAHYLLRSRPALEQYRAMVRGVTTFDRSVTREDFEAMPLGLPPMHEQRAIAGFLDAETARIDALIEKKRQLACLLGARYREERRARMLRGLDPITGSGLDSPGWRVAQLGVLIGLQRGHDLPIDQRKDGSVPVISSGGPSGWHNEAALVGPGVVTGRYGTIGEVYYVDGPYWPLNTTLYVHDFRGRDPKWIYHLLSVLPLDSDSAKSAVTGINRNVVGVLRVPVPSINEQRRLAKELDAKARHLRSLTDRLDAQIDLLAEHRQALITAAVTGEIEVPGA